VRAHPGVAVAEGVRSADLRRLLAVVEAARSGQAADGFPVAVLTRAQELVPCDAVSFTEFDPAQRRDYLDQSVPAEDAEPDPVFYRHYWECAACSYPDRSGDLLSVTTISDFYTRRQWHNTGMYADYVGPAGVEAEAMLCLSAPAGRARRLIFYRGPGPDFDGRDRLLLSLLRPHLNECYQELCRRRSAVPALTPRQWELLHLLAAGHSNAEIARQLVVSVATVRKHLENIFTRLGVTNRTAAIAKAFPAPPY
jgi:DNA-binding CsgD family transcriptional regulator